MEKEFTQQPVSLDSDDFEEYPFLAPILWDKIKYDDLVEVSLNTGRRNGKNIVRKKVLQHLHKEDKEREQFARRIE